MTTTFIGAPGRRRRFVGTLTSKAARGTTGGDTLAISRLAGIAIAVFAFCGVASAAPCDRACLLEHAKQFNANMLARTTEKIPLGPKAQIRENTRAIALAESK